MSKPLTSCATCGHQWPIGTDGTHSCVRVLERKVMLARNALLWIAVRCRCEEGPFAEKVASVANDALAVSKIPSQD